MIPYSRIEAQDVARLFVRYVWCNHGLPNTIISNQGTQFVSVFYDELYQQLKINPRLSTGYYPQTNGQTENANAVIEQVLRAYANYQQDD
jgi:transposase InsO family protein